MTFEMVQDDRQPRSERSRPIWSEITAATRWLGEVTWRRIRSIDALVGLALLIAAITASAYWLRGGVLLLDDGFFPFSPSVELAKNLSVWNYPDLPGQAYFGTFQYMPLITWAVFINGWLGLPLGFVSLSYLSLLEWSSGLGTYLLARTILRAIGKEGRSALAGAILCAPIYMFNWYKVLYIGGEFFPAFILISLLPVYLFAVVQYVRTGRLKFLVAGFALAGLMAAGFWEVPYLLWTVFALLAMVAIPIYPGLDIKTRAKRVLVSFTAFWFSAAWTLGALLYQTLLGASILNTTSVGGKSLLVAEYTGFQTSGVQTFLFLFVPQLQVGGPGLFGFPILSNAEFLAVALLSSALLLLLSQAFALEKSESSYQLGLKLETILVFIVALGVVDLSFLISPGEPLLSGLVFSTSSYWSIDVFLLFLSLLVAISVQVLVERVSGYLTASYGGGSERLNARRLAPNWRSHVRRSAPVVVPVFVVLLFVIPTMIQPTEFWDYGGPHQISGVVHPSSSLLKVGSYLSREQPAGNVLLLPIVVAPSSSRQSGSAYLSVEPPLSTFTTGQFVYEDSSYSPSELSYPLLKLFPSAAAGDVVGYLRTLGISRIVLDHNADPAWVSPPLSQYAEGYPYNYSAIEMALNTSQNITYEFTDWPYSVYTVSGAYPVVYGAEGTRSTGGSALPTPLQVYDRYSRPGASSTRNVLVSAAPDGSMPPPQTGPPCNVSYVAHGSDSYDLRVDATSVCYIVLNEQFDMGWRLLSGGSDVTFVHFIANGYANCWLAPVGKYTLTLVYAYRPVQNILTAVTLLSGLVLATLLAFEILGPKFAPLEWRARQFDRPGSGRVHKISKVKKH